jgi:tetrapyrrole methylase family protein/MazG family protein
MISTPMTKKPKLAPPEEIFGREAFPDGYPTRDTGAGAARAQAVMDLVHTVYRLRAPEGCPWDREQDHLSLRPYLIEEAYEVLDVIDKIESPDALKDEKIRGDFREELGDLLMQVVLHAELTREAGAFDFFDVARELNDKLVRRHTHVFGDDIAEDTDAVLKNWERQKAKEKAPKTSVLDGVPKGMPALQKAGRVIEKVTKVGFQWSDMEGPLAKVDEEIAELKHEIHAFQKDHSEAQRAKVEHEIGDALFTLANLAHLNGVSPEDALRKTLARFERRFRHVETRVKETGRALEDSNLEEMDRYWDEAKKLEGKH